MQYEWNVCFHMEYLYIRFFLGCMNRCMYICKYVLMYVCMHICAYRDRISAEVEGRPLPTELPVVKQSSGNAAYHLYLLAFIQTSTHL